MNRINTETWKEYKLKNIGFSIYHGIRQKQSDREDGQIPLLTAGKEKQGVAAYIANPSCQYEDPITVDMFGNSFFHKGIYSGDDNIYFFINKDLNDVIKIFISSIINTQNSSLYSFKSQFRQSQANALTVTLPSKADGTPDYKYMESYMKNIMEETERNIENLQNISVLKSGIQTVKWSNFSCSKLFTARNTGNILARDVEDGSGEMPYVTASGINNGVFAYIDASKYDIIKGHCILIGGKTFTVTYQADDFVSNDSHNFVIRTLEDNSSDLSYKYLVTVIRSYLGQKYSWNDAVTKDKFLNENIPLPAKPNGEPDWAYMENYMKNIMDNTKAKLNILKTAI